MTTNRWNQTEEQTKQLCDSIREGLNYFLDPRNKGRMNQYEWGQIYTISEQGIRIDIKLKEQV